MSFSAFRLLRSATLFTAASFAMGSYAASAPRSSASRQRQGPRIGIETTYGDRLREGGKAYAEKNYARAAAIFTSALEMKPDPKNALLAYEARAVSYHRLHIYRGAVADWEKVRILAPPNAQALNALAWMRATCPDDGVRNGRAAVRDATRACELTHWKNSDYLDTLAAAYAESGQFEQALQWETQALRFAPFDHRKVLEGHLANFKTGAPVREL